MVREGEGRKGRSEEGWRVRMGLREEGKVGGGGGLESEDESEDGLREEGKVGGGGGLESEDGSEDGVEGGREGWRRGRVGE